MRQIIVTTAILILMAFVSEVFSQDQKVDSVLQKYDRYWEMEPGLYRVMDNGRIGVADSRGREIVPCRYDQVWTPTKDKFIRVLLNMKTGLFHLEKGIILPAEYDQIWDFDEGIAKVMKDRRFGFADTDGRMVVPCEYQHVWAPHDGLIKVMKDGLTGYLSTNGEIIVPVVYQHIWDFEDGMARVIRDGKMGYVDMDGNEVIPAIYDQIWPFEGDMALVVTDGNYFNVDRQGNIIGEVDRNMGDAIRPDIDSTVRDPDNEKSGTHPRIRIEKDRIDIWHDGEGIRVEKERKKHHYFNGHLAGIGIAMNGYLDSEGREELPPGYEFMELNQQKSVEVTIYPWQESVRLFGSWFGLTTGLGVQYNNYRFNIETYADIQEPGRDWFPELNEETSVSKSKLMMLHLNVPVMAELQIPERHRSNNLFISGGIVGGVRLQSHTKLVYNNDEGRQKKKKRDDMGLPTFRYGVMAKAGFGNFSVYGTYYPEPMFKEGKGPELYPYSVGIMLNFD